MSEIGRTSEQIRKEHILCVEGYSMSAAGSALLHLCDDHRVSQG